MGLLDLVRGNKRDKPAEQARNMDVAKGLNAQSDEERSAARQRMEDEVAASRATRESGAAKDA